MHLPNVTAIWAGASSLQNFLPGSMLNVRGEPEVAAQGSIGGWYETQSDMIYYHVRPSTMTATHTVTSTTTSNDAGETTTLTMIIPSSTVWQQVTDHSLEIVVPTVTSTIWIPAPESTANEAYIGERRGSCFINTGSGAFWVRGNEAWRYHIWGDGDFKNGVKERFIDALGDPFQHLGVDRFRGERYVPKQVDGLEWLIAGQFTDKERKNGDKSLYERFTSVMQGQFGMPQDVRCDNRDEFGPF